MVRKKATGSKKKKGKAPQAPAATMETEEPEKPSVWLPGRDTMEEGESLQYDPTVYDCMTSMGLEWPCLSFDILRDHLGAPRSAFPHTLFMVAGTQAASVKLNYLGVMKVSNLSQGKHGQKAGGSDSDDGMADSDSEDEDEPAQLHIRKVAHAGGINRVRAMPQQQHVVATFADNAQVQIWDLSQQLAELKDEATPSKEQGRMVHKLAARQVHGHSCEGYALDWSPVAAGKMASGDCRSRIHVWEPSQAGRWGVSGAYKGHEGSVEDLQWSPTEETVFASCSVDQTIRIWDTREKSRSMLSVKAADSDVNVISWNRATTYMLASGADDGGLRVWDLRNFAEGSFVANLAYHRGPVTSVEWCPYESSMLVTTSSDNQLAVWDLALERDPEEEAALAPDTNAAAPDNLPAQLLFVHGGQQDPKEAHWHPQINGLLVSTAADGFNIFKPYNV